MDMQAEIKFTIESLKSSFKKVETRIVSEGIYPDGHLGDVFITFNEHSTVSAGLYAGNPEIVMEIDSYNSDEAIVVKPGETVIISSGKDEDDMLVPGSHFIAVNIGSKRYEGLFTVEPSSMSWKGVVNMRNYLESLLQGLSYDLISGRQGRPGDHSLYSVFLNEIDSFISEKRNMVVNNINSIISTPITNIKKTYREQIYSRRPDFKSGKWLSQKGSAVNGNQLLPEVSYEKHTVMDRENPENRFLRRIIHDVSIILCSLEENFETIYENLRDKNDDKQKELENEKESCEKTTDNFTLSERFKNRKKRRLEQLNDDIKGLEDRHTAIGKTIDDLKKFRSMLSHSEHHTWLQDIKGYEKAYKPSLTMLKDSRYLELYSFYMKLKAMEKNEHIEKNITFSHKRTSRLFEYYVVAMVVNILKSKGFSWISGWIADGKKSYNGELPIETVMNFSKGSMRCEMIYDMEVGSIPRHGFVRNNTRYCRPDISIAFYENEELKSALIIEVKCRKSKYLFSEEGDTSVIEQLKDYYNFGYKGSTQDKMERGRIDQVIAVYPRQSRVIYYDGDYNFSFIQMEPGPSIDETYGYKELEKEIEHFM